MDLRKEKSSKKLRKNARLKPYLKSICQLDGNEANWLTVSTR